MLWLQRLSHGMLLRDLPSASDSGGEAGGATLRPKSGFEGIELGRYHHTGWLLAPGVPRASPGAGGAAGMVAAAVRSVQSDSQSKGFSCPSCPCHAAKQLGNPFFVRGPHIFPFLNYTEASREEMKERREITPCLLPCASLSSRAGRLLSKSARFGKMLPMQHVTDNLFPVAVI